jgi:starch synthase
MDGASGQYPAIPSPIITPDGRTLTVVHVAGELAPVARTGGLGEAVASLAKYLSRSGIPTAVVLPYYRQVRENGVAVVPVGDPFDVVIGTRTETARLLHLPQQPAVGDSSIVRVFFIENPEYFDRPGVYGESGADYPDNARRYSFFCAAALQALPQITRGAVLVHAHDWHTALVPVYLRTRFDDDPFYAGVRSIFSVHNAGYQGHFPVATMAEIGLPMQLFNWQQLEWYGRVNLLKGGLVFADAATTVSPTHAHELRTKAGGFGLDGVFIALRDRFVGILNGIDQIAWNPERDPVMPYNYSAEDLRGKRRCRWHMQNEFGLQRRAGVPIFAMTARLVSQKGIDLILDDPGFFALDAQYIFLGHGEPRYEAALTAIASRARSRIAVDLDFTDRKEHLLLAGADVCLMPSQYEPCGLTQMRAQRYGTIPVARRVGGLADTIEDGVTGFVFDAYTPRDFVVAVVRAMDQYRDRAGWKRMMREAMARDFGWERSVVRYRRLYERVLESPPVTQAV